VLSRLECPSRSWTARRFFVRRQIDVALVRRSGCVPQLAATVAGDPFRIFADDCFVEGYPSCDPAGECRGYLP